MNRCARLVTLTAIAALPLELAHAFTAEQAEAGRASYTQSCVACHGADLRMLPTAPLAGRRVHREVAHAQHERLARAAAHDDAAREPGQPRRGRYLGVMAYILQRNGNAPSEDRLLAASGEPIAAGAGGGRRAARRRRGRRACSCTAPSQDFVPLTDQVLRNPAPGDWPMIRRDYSASSFSPLDEITAAQRRPASARVDLADARRRLESAGAARLPRHDLSQQHRRRRAGDRRARRQPDLGAPHR